jgi:hypothetical protein
MQAIGPLLTAEIPFILNNTAECGQIVGQLEELTRSNLGASLKEEA